MDSALWLVLALPAWYFATLTSPFSAGALTLVPALGAISLAAGVVLAVKSRQRRLAIFLIPFAFSEVLVAVAGALRGQVDGFTANAILMTFLAMQVGFSGWLVYRLKGARTAASALAIFSITYALFGAFIAVMSFADTWL